MKHIFFIIFLAIFSLPVFSQTAANTLVISAPNDLNTYTIYVGGQVVCDSCVLEKESWVLRSIYSRKIRIRVESEGLSCVRDLILSPKTNDLQEPFKTTYKIIRQSDKLILKRVSSVSLAR